MTPEEMLADAKAQLHLLMTGQMAQVYVDQNGERVEYTRANRADLAKYVDRLANEINGTKPGPMRVLM